MRVGALIFFSLIVAVLSVRADEFLSVLKVGSDVYSNVTVTKVTATDVFFTCSQGMANAKLKNLDPELVEHFKSGKTIATTGAIAGEKKAETSSSLAEDVANPAVTLSIGRGNAQAIMPLAVARAKNIINQPVRSLRRTADMLDVGSSGPIWFHPGSIKPDFEIVDVRKTQDISNYSKYTYVTSDLNPGVVFRGADVEFNSMTKYFYEDRILPKKKLTEAEMVELNRVYHMIGLCENEMDDHGNLRPLLSVGYLSLHKQVVIYGVAAILVLLVITRLAMGGGRRTAANAA